MKKLKILFVIITGFVICAGIFVWLVYTGVVKFNSPSLDRYPVRGIDVSSYQGDIDWDIIKEQNIKFAFIKATEGSSFTDSYFHDNYKNAIIAGLRVGAYHFFSYDSPGETQAKHFIKTVEKTDDMLPPVLDVEFYSDYYQNPLEKSRVKLELEACIAKIKEAYGIYPIIYATTKAYDLYIKDEFQNCDIWIRDVYFPPSLPDERKWIFWQYADKGILKGYNGKEKYIDLNVFYGTEFEFENYAK